MFDVNCGCGVWPFRPTPPADAASLEAMLRAVGVTRACAYPLEAYLWPDPQEANELRLPQLAESDFFVPSAVLNPTLPGCLKAYRRCREKLPQSRPLLDVRGNVVSFLSAGLPGGGSRSC